LIVTNALTTTIHHSATMCHCFEGDGVRACKKWDCSYGKCFVWDGEEQRTDHDVCCWEVIQVDGSSQTGSVPNYLWTYQCVTLHFLLKFYCAL